MNDRRLKLAAAAGAILLGGLATATLAHPHPDGDKGDKVREVIVITDKHGDKGEKGKAHHFRTVRVDRRDGGKGPAHHFRTMRLEGRDGAIHCDGKRTEIAEESGDKEKTRIVICGRDGATSAETAERLERALERIRANDELSAEHKEKVTAALREAIERSRAGN